MCQSRYIMLTSINIVCANTLVPTGARSSANILLRACTWHDNGHVLFKCLFRYWVLLRHIAWHCKYVLHHVCYIIHQSFSLESYPCCDFKTLIYINYTNMMFILVLSVSQYYVYIYQHCECRYSGANLASSSITQCWGHVFDIVLVMFYSNIYSSTQFYSSRH